jgi:hypothetical protein
MGLTPQRAAKEASLRIRSGLSPATRLGRAALGRAGTGRDDDQAAQAVDQVRGLHGL